MKKSLLIIIGVVFLLGLVGTANATLYDRGGGLIYDSDQDITWLQNANYAGIIMNWANAVAWADTLSYYDSVRGVTWDDWRLPTTMDGPYVYGYDGTTTAGHNITTSEMGYMYYVNLGNLGYYTTDGNYQSGYGVNNTGPFDNLQPIFSWSGTEYASEPACAWGFFFYNGLQTITGKAGGGFAWAVRPGDVSAVPIPSAIWLLGSGLIGIVGFWQKLKKI